MKRFGGFPAGMRFTPVPNPFFSHLMPAIDDIAELKATLAVFYSVFNKRGLPRFATYRELAADAGLMRSRAAEGATPEDRLRAALGMAVERGTLVHLAGAGDGVSEDVYFLNTEADRQAIERIRSGETVLPGLKPGPATKDVIPGERPGVFTLYEDNIGMLTPMISEQLRDAQRVYPDGWVRDAIRQAANQNKRKWSYISAVLERWAAEGRTDGAYRRDTKKTDPDKYIKGKYGHMVQR